MSVEVKIAGIILIAASAVAYIQPSPKQEDAGIRYAKFDLQVKKTPIHDAYDVSNGIIVEPPDYGNGVDKANLRFCAPGSNEWMEVPISDTDYFERDKAITPREEKGEVSSKPFNAAMLGKEPCTLVVGNTVLRAGAQKLAIDTK